MQRSMKRCAADPRSRWPRVPALRCTA